ncbi:LolA family protein [Francisella philomiragia]|uniref:LolA family protein n=1 Tax=Francisella philomiragia TaxID=28110 RepID=UPI001C9D6E92|nr:outer membrane lipoprotein carrier protein LolA [Francisella philomiragia]MBY7734627.1 outer membrane lipoprotein carrier protein LolA [Francisella philomiragia]
MKRLFTFISIFLTIVAPLYALDLSKDSDFQAVEKQLTKDTNISGKFIQIRQIAGLNSSLKSSGTFKLTNDGSLLWQQQSPIKTTMQMSKNKLTQTIMDNPPTVLTRDDQPIVFTFTSVFMSVFKGDTKTISEFFNINFDGNTQNWTITLIPKSSPLNKAIKEITLKGNRYITNIDVADTQDNIIKIQLFDITTN